MKAISTSKAVVNAAIVSHLLPSLYKAIDDLISDNTNKKVIASARALLPQQYKHSFQHVEVKK